MGVVTIVRKSFASCWRWAGMVALLASLGCASVTTSGGPGAGTRPHASEPARPGSPADYDVMVGSLAAFEGRLEEARAAFARAAHKDPDSAFIERMLGRLAAQLDDLDAALGHGERALALAPDDSRVRLFLGRLYRIRRDVEGAEGALLASDGFPISTEAALLLYRVYLEANHLQEALALALRIVAREPERLGGHMAAATAHERLGQLSEAEGVLRRALDHHPGRFVLYSRLARMRRAAGDRAGEIEIYREVLATHPDHYGTLVSLAEALVALEDVEGAIQTYETIIDRYPDDHRSIRRLASLEFTSGRRAEAAVRLERALARDSEHFEFAYALGQVWWGLGEQEAAMAAFERIPAGNPIYLDARLRIAEIFEDAEDYAAALAEVERVREVNPERSLAFHAAALRWRAGNFEEGVALLEEMRAADPDDDEVLYQLGVLHGLAKKMDQAIHYMREALARNPDNANALNYIGYTWAERGTNLDEAEAMILRALELRPDDGYITDSLGWVYYMRARPLIGAGRVRDGRALLERAREQLSLAARLTGGDSVVSEHLGDVHLLFDQKERALEFYEEALGLDPREDEQPDLFDKVDDLRRKLDIQ